MRYLILLCLLNPVITFADTSLWRVSKGDSELFIGGTIHMLSHRDYPLPVEFEMAYKKADMVVFETDIQAMTQQENQQKFITRVTYKGNKTLKDDLRPKTYSVLTDYLSSIGLNIGVLNQYKPPMIMITLVLAELQRLELAEAGVDEFFNKKALVDGKALGELESFETQLSVIENLAKGHEDEMVLSTITDMKKLSVIMTDMKIAWRAGDVNTLEKLGIMPMKSEFPELYQLLLVKRNNSWIPKIEELLKTPEVELVLVGALHLVGSEGVFSKLRAQGYTVELFENN
ncbi:MAG: TraB/GumN family protein [Methylococcaceae bacterium]|nr:TraB/GumN family protein [Methylococcaceae bacterium]